ncbi:hypothetical protein [Phenylobacterium sp.]|uniref:DUF968 domain-containing protein n=1 Tax=Phenylobacterium sp. TaxID=1871053 RepID=UPI002638B792|nr:hypothetical protein [Phenylobacterium sp.]
MTLDHDARERLRILRAEVRKLEQPAKLATKSARKAEAQRRRKAVTGTPGQRQPRVRDNAYLAFVRRQPCMKCGTTQRVEAAHVRAGYPEDGWRPTGMQEKPDDVRTLPLCRDCHREGPDAQHKRNERTFWSDLGIYPPDACRSLRKRFEAGE